jgi:3-dehydroquinate synthase
LLAAFGLPLAVPSGIDHEELLRLMWHDKKVSDNQLVFVLPSRIGQVELVADVDSALVLASLQQAAN